MDLQVHLYVPQQGHDSFGVVRAIVQDSNDAGSEGSLPFFLDSDGCVSYPNCPTSNRNITMVSVTQRTAQLQQTAHSCTAHPVATLQVVLLQTLLT